MTAYDSSVDQALWPLGVDEVTVTGKQLAQCHQIAIYFSTNHISTYLIFCPMDFRYLKKHNLKNINFERLLSRHLLSGKRQNLSLHIINK